MASRGPSSVQDQMADVTECTICMSVFTNPKILPCVHTFCLECLEKYGGNKKTGDHMACPICRNEYLIPDGGFCSLPHNFFIDKMVEIRKLSETSTHEALCGTCPDEDKSKAGMFCFECEHNLCERCATAHRKIKFCQNHQVIEIGDKLKPKEVTFRNSCCDQHTGELIKMYCVDDKTTICILCFAEGHQSHKCVSVNKASEEFTSTLKSDLKTVTGRLPELQISIEQLDKWKKDLFAQSVVVEKQIADERASLHTLIDHHADVLTAKLTALKHERLKEIESMKDEVERFKVTIEGYTKYSEELLSKGAPGDICREADQLQTRARELASLTTNSCDPDFNCDIIIFKWLNLEDVLQMSNIGNVIGDVHVEAGSVKDQVSPVFKRVAADRLCSVITADDPSSEVPDRTRVHVPTFFTFFPTFDPRAIHFILKRPELQMHIEDSLEKLNCRVQWPSNGERELYLEYKGTETQKPISGWAVDCNKFLQTYADELSLKKENILPEIWEDFKENIKEQTVIISNLLDVAFENDQCQIQYLGMKKDTTEFETIIKEIKGDLEKESVPSKLLGFIGEEAILEKSMPMELGVVDMITKYLTKDLHKIWTELRNYSGSILSSRDEPGFTIRGPQTGIGKAAKDLLKLTERIAVYNHDIHWPGIVAYFESASGQNALRAIQINHKVSIQLKTTQMDGPREYLENKKGRCAASRPPHNQEYLPTRQIGKADAVSNWFEPKMNFIGNDPFSANTRDAFGGAAKGGIIYNGILQQRQVLRKECHPQHLEGIIFSIYALSENASDDARREIDRIFQNFPQWSK